METTLLTIILVLNLVNFGMLSYIERSERRFIF